MSDVMSDIEISDLDDTATLQSNMYGDPLAHLTLDRAISLRWTLRDVAAQRTKFLPLADDDLQFLIDVGLVEMKGDQPALTEAGLAAIE